MNKRKTQEQIITERVMKELRELAPKRNKRVSSMVDEKTYKEILAYIDRSDVTRTISDFIYLAIDVYLHMP